MSLNDKFTTDACITNINIIIDLKSLLLNDKEIKESIENKKIILKNNNELIKEYTNCMNACANSCSGTCLSTCSHVCESSCSNACSGDCSNECKDSCKGTCSSLCVSCSGDCSGCSGA